MFCDFFLVALITNEVHVVLEVLEHHPQSKCTILQHLRRPDAGT